MTGPENVTPEPGPDADIGEIQADIDATRSELGDTVAELSAKLDVKAQARAKVEHAKDSVVDKAQDLQTRGAHIGSEIAASTTRGDGSTRRLFPVSGLVAVLLIAGTIWWRRRRR